MAYNNSSIITNDSYIYLPKMDSTGETIAIASSMVVTFLVALLGNSVVIYVILRVRSMQTATNLLLVNLSVADLVIAILNLPFKTVSTYMLYYWPFGNPMCKLSAFCHIMIFFVSISSLMAIACERYAVICKPRSLNRINGTTYRIKHVVIVTWIAGVAGASPMLKFFETTSSVCPDGRGICEFCASTGWTIDALKVYSVVVLFSFFLFPLLVMSFAYINVGRTVWQSARNTRSMRRYKNHERSTKSRITKISLAMIFSFVIAWGPTFGKRMYSFLSEEANRLEPEVRRKLYTLFHLLQYSNCALNPLLYSFMSQKFRQAFKLIYRRSVSGNRKFFTLGAQSNISMVVPVSKDNQTSSTQL